MKLRLFWKIYTFLISLLKNLLTISLKYGVVAANEYPDLNFEALLKTADDMMYQHKREQNERR